MRKRCWTLILLLLLLPAIAFSQGTEIRLTAEQSDVLPEGALRALSQWLASAVLTAEQNEAALRYDGEMLLSAWTENGEGFLTAGDLTCPAETSSADITLLPEQAADAAARLGEVLKAYEKQGAASAELGGAVRAKTQLSYALSQEQWQRLWPDVCGVLGEALDSVAMESKGTFRRYFDADGAEIGAYFYAEKVRIAEDDVREVRLEYAYQPGKGLYLAFRCPNKNETRNVRISLTAKRTERTDRISYSFSGDIRVKGDGGQDRLLAEASLKNTENKITGKLTLNYTKKRGDKTVKYALELKPDLTPDSMTGGIAYACDKAGQRVLAGKILLADAQTEEKAHPPVNAEYTAVTSRLTRMLYETLLETDAQDRMQLIYYLNRSAFLTGEEKQIDLAYDPEFTVTEVSEE